MKQKDLVYALLDILKEIDGDGIFLIDEDWVVGKLFEVTNHPEKMAWLAKVLDDLYPEIKA